MKPFEKKEGIIVDIDGTLADVDHRLHFIKGDKDSGKRDWKSFFKAAEKDEAFAHMKFVNNLVMGMGKLPVILVTGRPENLRKDTTEWLKNHDIHYHQLHMRPSIDRSPDFECKKRIYEVDILPFWNIHFVFEDRLAVAKMWREQNLPVFLCGDAWITGDWSK